MTERIIIAHDPGKMTGVATWYGDEFLGSAQDDLLEVLNGTHKVLQEQDALTFIRTTEPFEIVIIAESYTITPATIRKSRQHYSLEGIGALRWMSHRFGAKFVLQSPADAKRFMTDDKLQKLGWYQKGRDHANDSARHLALYMVRAGRLDTRLLIGG